MRFSPDASRALHWVAVGVALFAIGTLALADRLDLLDFRPGGRPFEINETPIFMAMLGLAVVLALRWRIVGGTIAALTVAAVAVFAGQQLRPGSATFVIVAFAVPAVLWIAVALNGLRPRQAAVGLVGTAVAIAAGALIADRTHDTFFGPTHPESRAEEVDEGRVEWIWSGAVTDRSFVVAAKLDPDARSARLVVSEDPELVGAWTGPALVPDDGGVVRLAVGDLDPGTRYHYAVQVDGGLERAHAATVRTFPIGPSSFTIAIGSDASVGSNGAVFDAIRAFDPLLYLIIGDWHYGDIDEPRPREFEEVYDVTLTAPGQAALYRSAPVVYVWDDHDFGGNDSDATSDSAPAAHDAYRRFVPHYELAGPAAPVYQAFTVGRVRFIVTDQRSGRTPASAPDDSTKSMLGAEQKAWFEQQLLDANGAYPLIVWVSPLPWIIEARSGADHWGGYATERAELADFIADNDIEGLLMLSGDAHMVAVDDGTNSDYSASGGAGFPVMHAAALDRRGEVKGGPYTEGTFPGGGRFGLMSVDDNGAEITVSLSGRTWDGQELVAYEFTVGG